MRKRLIPFLALVITLSVFAVPDTQASCLRCSWGQQRCVDVNYPWAEYCEWLPAEETCYLEGDCLARLAESSMALSAEYRVASVERLDEPAAPRNEMLTAELKRD